MILRQSYGKALYFFEIPFEALVYYQAVAYTEDIRMVYTDYFCTVGQ